MTAKTVIVGAGPTGLSAAYHLGAESTLLEQHDRVGGWCRSIEEQGFTFDHAGHILFSKDPYVHELYDLLLGDNIHWQDREAWIYSKDVYTRYPFQGSLYGLPPDVIRECVIGAIDARYGRSQSASAQTDVGNDQHNGGTAAKELTDCCADGILESTTRLVASANGGRCETAAPENFEQFIYRTWGAGIAKHFAIPYNRKLWAVPLDEMETSWLGGRVPMPELEEMIEGALQPAPKPMGPNARFGYVLRGGCQALMDAFVPHLKGEVRLRARAVKVSVAERTLSLEDGSELPYSSLISTMPLPVLINNLIGLQAPPSVRAAAAGLRHVSVRCVNIGIGRADVTNKHWIYYPEDTVFHRVFVQGNASPHCNPPGGFGLTCEITYSPYKPLPCDGQALIDRCIADCHRVGLFTSEDPVWVANQVDLPYAYVVYDHERASNVAVIRDWLAQFDVVLAGRYSEWEYYNSDHAFIAGKIAADKVRQARPRPRGRMATIASLPATSRGYA